MGETHRVVTSSKGSGLMSLSCRGKPWCVGHRRARSFGAVMRAADCEYLLKQGQRVHFNHMKARSVFWGFDGAILCTGSSTSAHCLTQIHVPIDDREPILRVPLRQCY